MNVFIKVIKSLENSSVLIDRTTETTKRPILGVLLRPLAASVVQPVIYSEVKVISGRGVGRAWIAFMKKTS